MAIPICSVCTHPEHAAIDAALTTGAPLIPTAARFGVSKSALHRHKIGCLAPKLAAAARMVQPTKALKAPVQRAKAIAAGTVQPDIDDILSLGALCERMARSLERLENGAISAAGDNLHTAHAALAAQLHRGCESIGKLKGYYNDSPSREGAPTFTISINIPEIGTAPASRVIDCTPKASAPAASRIPNTNFGIEIALDAAADLCEDQ